VFAAWTQAMVTTAQSGSHHPFQGDGWRLAAPPAPVRVELDRPVTVDRANGRVDDMEVTELLAERHVMVLDIDGRRQQAVVNAGPHTVDVVYQGQRSVFTRPDVFAGSVVAGSDGTVKAPMPGTVLAVAVRPGQVVAGGDVLATLEAMKMELEIKAPHDATVAEVAAQAGDRVGLGQRLFSLTLAEEG
jgi:biotin carboxyl carrier protein